MNAWSKAPFVRITIPFVAGILMYRAGWNAIPAPAALSFLISLLVALCAWLFLLPRLQSYKTRNIQGTLLLLSVLLTGYVLAYSNDFRNDPQFIGKLKSGDQNEMILRIDNEVEQKSSTFKTSAQAVAVKKDGEWISCRGKILLYFSRNDSSKAPRYGDLIVTRMYMNPVDGPIFNSDFDYKKYLSDKNIFHQAYLGDDSWTLLDSNQYNPLLAFALDVRNNMVSILHDQLGDNDEYAIVSAMLAGYRADLSADMMQAYSKAGVIHIMSVSGLHVGVIYIMISAFLGLFAWLKKKKWLRVVIVLLLIWFYAMITGLSASVLRSAVMISFIVVGEALQRKINPFNSLSAAAFILLAINPGSIGDVGFQLSFAAVAGIFLFQKPIYRLWYIRNKWADKIWQLACVSLAAQLATLPMILYYFGQFPVYFLLTNIVVVPLSGFVLYASMAAVLLGWIPGVGDLLVWGTMWLTKIMNTLVFSVESMPFAVVENIYLAAIPALMLSGIIILGYLMYTEHRIRLLFPLLIIAIFAVSWQWKTTADTRNESFAFALKDGRQYLFGIKKVASVYVFGTEKQKTAPSPYVLNRLRRFSGRNNLQIVPVANHFNDSSVYRRNDFVSVGSLQVMICNEKRLPALSDSLNSIDAIFAPSITAFQQMKYLVIRPNWQLLTRAKVDDARLLDLNEQKDWKFELRL